MASAYSPKGCSSLNLDLMVRVETEDDEETEAYYKGDKVKWEWFIARSSNGSETRAALE